MKRIYCFILMLISVMMLSSCRLNDDIFRAITVGDFVYSTLEVEKYNRLSIIGISKEGRQKETLVFPSIVDGYYVDGIGDEFGFEDSDPIYITNATNVYFPGFYDDDYIYYIYPDDREVNIYDPRNLSPFYVDLLYRPNTNIYTSSDSYENMIEYHSEESKNLKPANVVYYSIDVGDTEYWSYFVDDCDGTVVNVIPPTPYRKGYIFTGWYKEEECINKWDFEKDIIPAKEYDEEGNYIFKETSIYAGWEKEVDPFNSVTIGDFIYSSLNSDTGKVKIIGISEEGYKKDTLIFPSEVDGFCVDGIGDSTKYDKSGPINLKDFKSVYFSGLYEIDSYFYTNSNEKINIYIHNYPINDDIFSLLKGKQNISIYVIYQDIVWMLDEEMDISNFKPANVIYFSTNSENSVHPYFVDDCDGTVVNVIPPTPYREGYTFTGWYKEEQCINKWDFEKDIIPAKEYDEEGNYINKETKIYAGWEKSSFK